MIYLGYPTHLAFRLRPRFDTVRDRCVTIRKENLFPVKSITQAKEVKHCSEFRRMPDKFMESLPNVWLKNYKIYRYDNV